MSTALTVLEILLACEQELELPRTYSTDAQVLGWINRIYNRVMEAEEYDWRKQSSPLLTYPVAEGSGIFVPGALGTHGGLTNAAIGSWSTHNLVKVDDELPIYSITNIVPAGCLMTFSTPYLGPTGSFKPFKVFHCFYVIPGIQEDWIRAVYLEDNEVPLPRLYPVEMDSWVRYASKNPGTPQAFYTIGRDPLGKGVLLGISPAPDAEYTLTISTLAGATTLTEADYSSTTLIPPGYDRDLFITGVGMLHCIAKKDQTGVQMYAAEFQIAVRKLMEKTAKRPGGESRVTGYIQKQSGWDPMIPLDWTEAFE